MLLAHPDYSWAKVVKGCPVGLSFDPDTLSLPTGHFIGGRLIPADGAIECAGRPTARRDHILPTGGYKRSGLGKDLGREAYLANRNSKSVLIGL